MPNIVVGLWQEGRTLREIAAMMLVSHETVRQWLKKDGVNTYRKQEPWTLVEVICDLCGKKFIRRQCYVDKSLHHFCSQECGGIWKRGKFFGKRGSENPCTKLTEEKVIDIRETYREGHITQRELAAEHGVCNSTISHIINYRIWRHLDGVIRDL